MKQHFRHLITILPLLLTLGGFSLPAQAVTSALDIYCAMDPDTEMKTDCYTDASGYTSPDTLQLAADIIAVASGGEGELCYDMDGIVTCYLGGGRDVPISLVCNLNQTVTNQQLPQDVVAISLDGEVINSASCYVDSGQGNIPSDLISVECSETADEAGCTFATNTSGLLAGLPDNALGNNLKELAESFLSCAVGNTRGGDFQTYCDQILAEIAAPIPNWNNVLELLQSLQALNPDNSIDTSWFIQGLAQGNLLQRLQQLRSGQQGGGNNQQAWLHQGEWLPEGTQLASSAEIASDATPTRNISEYGKLGFFINASSLNAEQKDAIERATESDAVVITLGIDYRFTDDVFGGLAYSIGNSNTDYNNNAGELDADSYLVMLYGSWYQQSWFVDGVLSLGGDSYEQSRNSGNQVYDADYHGSQTALALTGGYDWHADAWNVTGFAQLTAGKVKTDAYREVATVISEPDLSMTFNSQTRDILTLNVGTNVQYVVATGKGVFIPLFTLQLVNELDDEAQVVTGRFLGNDTSSTFELATNDIDLSYIVVGAGFNFQLKNGNAGFVRVESVESYENLDQVRYTAGWRWEL